MKRPKIFAGDRLRRFREQHGTTQAALADALEISPAYLSQIESDQRPITRRLLKRLGDLYRLDANYFANDDDSRLASELRESASDPMFGTAAFADEATAAVRVAPGIAQRFLHLYRAYLALEEEHRSLQTLIVHDDMGAASRFPYDEVRDWVQSKRNHFDVLDRAAERLAAAKSFSPENRGEDFARHLRDEHRIKIDHAGEALGSGMIWRLDRNSRTLFLSKDATTESRMFWIAHVIGLLEETETIDRQVRQARLSNDEAAALARVALANYYAGAIVMPYESFLRAARETRYDVERLQRRFGTSFEQVCHRLSTLQRRSSPGIPFYFLKIDIAGNVLKRSSATRFQFARFGGPCPLWNVHQSFSQPGRILVQLATTPDLTTYLCVARTVGLSAGSYLSRPRAVAVGLGCEIAYASQTVYSKGIDLEDVEAAVLIGPGCRACERTDCRHRALPPIGRALDVGTAERGVVPYRIETKTQ
ncbi:helix-turn-helix domain-containing protein [Bradyrhizobium yuanmingense]|uniref:helix-turn-helix domain-containing protein n=1 Tax=Bradyrhizobium yuanmingense TaxID=108015 RepID=UPI0023B92DC1|nr:helix-turn-helix transcriptional regulator [Bradyrhizobium yuanmingense]MDF0584927.1 short-chain fatty acyl-CoA regulator family protein [Bradyrhizobium yuanmingense]